ncbi:MAG: glycosyltransferase [Clostridia bacterium]|nr:glycosyltransferase [Clostridia bacterium]
MKDKVLATITTYNPELDLLERNIDAVVNQVDKLLVYENASKNREEIVSLCRDKGVEIILNDKNYGVSGPLHDGLEYASDNGYSYICTFDQDSVSSEGMINALLNLIKSDDSLAIVAAQPVMTVNGVIVSENHENKFVKDVVTSGSLADVAKLKKTGGYMPEMLIDWVDTEICFRALNCGYKIMQSNVPLIHQFGNPVRRKFLWKWCIVTNYSPFRCYYISRNSAFCAKIYKKDLAKRRKKYLLKLKIKILFYETNKREKFKALKQGKKDAKEFSNSMIKKYSFLTEKQGENQ